MELVYLMWLVYLAEKRAREIAIARFLFALQTRA